ncbi:MAG: Crp/Fnr family transcriptional regulator [Pseudolabrys sp.]|nr:Crp/Fnr family transcriptional regulator [Pseudolabrys sp.]
MFSNNLCNGLTQAALAAALPASAIHDHTAPARRSIWREGETVERVPVICQGWAATAITLSDGRRQILSFLLPGDLVSAALIFQTASQCSVDAITEVRYRTFPRGDIKAALRAQPDLFAAVSRILSGESMRSDRLAIDLGRRGAAERIANMILNLAERLRRRDMMAGETMDFPLRQHHIADAVGLTVVHVGNVLAEFRRARLVEINDRSLTILDPDALRRVAEAV